MSYDTDNIKKPGLFTAIAIGVGCIVGSGWLFASYNAARLVGPMSFVSWIMGALLALTLAFLLAETASMFTDRGFFARILTFSHKNNDYGFLIAVANLFGLILVIPSEASATIQYLSHVYPLLMTGKDLSLTGELWVCLLVLLYGAINFWGMRLLSQCNNVITLFKFIVPISTGFLLIIYAGWDGHFSLSNFTLRGFYTATGVQETATGMMGPAVSAVVQAGIFYSFYGFAMIAIFGTELDKPQKTIPLALISCVLLCLGVYLLLQFAFIGAMPANLIAGGWSHIGLFTSPLAQLLGLIGVNIGVVTVLYIDSAVSPSGTGALYMASSARMITGMSQDGQLPSFFNKISERFNLSRRSLTAVFAISIFIVFFAKNWQNIMIIVTVFQLLACVAIPVALVKLRKSEPDRARPFKMPGGTVLSYMIFLVLAYLTIQAHEKANVFSLIAMVGLFVVYAVSKYKGEVGKIMKAFASSWSLFLYLAVGIVFSHLSDINAFNNAPVIVSFIVIYTISYYSLIYQKNHNK